MSAPEISVVVPSHDRPLRLRWLLNALEEQTLERERWEVVVGHDSSRSETDDLLRSHPLAEAGVLRRVTLSPGSAMPGGNRNAALGLARAPLIAFTDDDCRPPPDWLARALDAATRHPGDIVQGATRPDPWERASWDAAPWARSQQISPPVPWAQTCNIVYPRELIDRVGGFDERILTGEDTELAVRAQQTGARLVGAPEVLTYHAVETPWLGRHLRSLWRWQHLPYLIKKHPSLRDSFTLWAFWKPTHLWLPVAAAGAALERRNPLYALLILPWLAHSAPNRGTNPRGRYRALLEMPGRLAIDLTEMAALARGSIRSRTFFL